MATILIQGSGDVGSAVAHTLFSSGYPVVIQEVPRPEHTRRSMAFTDAVFDGHARLEGVIAKRVNSMECLPYMFRCHRALPVSTGDLAKIVSAVRPDVIVDARMRKRCTPDALRGSATLTIGLGPNFLAGENVDVAIETSWETRSARLSIGDRKRLCAASRGKSAAIAVNDSSMRATQACS